MSQHNSQYVFNSKEDYNVILDNMSREFEERWNHQTQSPYTNLDNYITRAVLGNGSFGTMLVREKSGKNYYAAKMMSKEDLVRLKQVAHVHNEKHVLNAARFPFLIYLVDSTKCFDYLYLILPLVNGGELFSYHRRVRKFNEKHARFYAAQVALALEYMHKMHLMYRDLKPENILLDQRGYIKITDFGFTKRVDGRTSTLCGTPEYLAPEIVQLRPYNKSVDWWAFGILVYEFVAGRSPFAIHNRDVILMYSKICICDYKMPSYFTAQLRSLVESLMQVDTSKRKLERRLQRREGSSVVPGRRLVRHSQPGSHRPLPAHHFRRRRSVELRELRVQGSVQVPNKPPSRIVCEFLNVNVSFEIVVFFSVC
ncbi:cAMP-dependent protein kinase catalytic subunit 2 isoform X2 [Drosophila mauritiana]|uniref:cAMP-dependent protein kinase catalytic subunit 2 isoform X2 n=1 Tax=Drosophila mauritiana TaxID=7226 RepID=A0A6P8KC63_DROMA|nr:cAMP-dependent protein kinase catalytic subunit 2 isoform X2 [Drosophila mauritiana]